MPEGYTKLRTGAAWFDVSARGRIRVTGEDRARLLHAMASNDVLHLKPGEGCYTFFLSAQGRILADAILLCFEDHFLLDTEPERRALLYEHLDKYIIADDVALEDITDATREYACEGPLAEPPSPLAPYAHVEDGGRTVFRASVTGQPGFRVVTNEAMPVDADAEDVRTVRLENGVPRCGEDFSDRHLPHETQLLEAVHFNKGCYLGQEIVERVRSRGNVHRLLVRIAADRAVEPGTKITAGGSEAGEVTSTAFSPAQGRHAGLAYVRTGIPPGAALRAGEAVVEITAMRPGPR